MSDKISAPEHYTFGKYQPKDVIWDWHLDFYLGNVIKYIARAGRKEDSSMIDDLRKARQYIDFELEKLQENSQEKMPQSVTQRRGILITNNSRNPITESDLRESCEWDDGR